MTAMTSAIRAVTVVLALALSFSVADAQGVPPVVRTPVRPQTGSGQPSGSGAPTQPGSNAGDSTRSLSRERTIFDWLNPDSTMRALLDREGYKKVRYQGDTVRFDAQSRVLTLRGKPSGVQRDETMLVGDTIIYNDSTRIVVARGDSVILRDPTQADADDFIANGEIEYDLVSRQGVTGAFSTSVTSGQRLFLSARQSLIVGDSLVSGRHIVYASNGSFTYCDHPEPHFHFTTGEMKFVSENVMIARPGVLYIGNVPVFWIPFFFQDVRSGRRSGLLTPNFGMAELFRNSPSYRRSVQNIGYFVAINDYMNFETSFDWRSSARSSASDPGFIRGNAELRYKWLSRFVTGEVATSYMGLRNGTTNTSYTWNHNQDFSRDTRLTARLNWVQNTMVQRATTVNPVAANATIRSQLNYQTKVGPAQMSLGGSRVQYPGRTQVDMEFPSLSVTTGSLEAGPATWTPSLRVGVTGQSRMDQGLQFPFVYNVAPNGGLDSSRFNASRRSMQFQFDTPIKLWDFQWQNSISIRDEYRGYPEQREIIGVRDTSQRSTRVFARTFDTNVDWQTSFNLPRFFQGTWNISPAITLSNVESGAGLILRTERSGGRWVQQSKRLNYTVSSSPTLYAMLPGIGPIARFRHSITPSISYSYSPQASVSDEFLEAMGRSRIGYVGALKQNRIGLSLATNLEAKLKAPDDSLNEGDAAGRKIKLLSLNFSSLSYDFVRADTLGNGISDRTFSMNGRTDLLPGFDFRVSYDLFQGDMASDTAKFDPYRTDFGVTFSLDGKSGIVALLGRLVGLGASLETDSATAAKRQSANDQMVDQQSRNMNAAGGGTMRGMQMALPSGRGWTLNVQYNAARQRPPRGGTQVLNNPEALCAGQRVNGILAYDMCIQNAISSPPTGLNSGQSAIGAPVFLQPPVQNVSATMSFNITPNWAAQWMMQYDVERARFSGQQLGLQRTMHDWNAVFSFSQTPNGNFAFNFFVALKAQPELKFNYDRQTYRSSGY